MYFLLKSEKKKKMLWPWPATSHLKNVDFRALLDTNCKLCVSYLFTIKVPMK